MSSFLPIPPIHATDLVLVTFCSTHFNISKTNLAIGTGLYHQLILEIYILFQVCSVSLYLPDVP